jgi:hypothetical protein
MEEGYTYGYNNARDAVSLTPRKHRCCCRPVDEPPRLGLHQIPRRFSCSSLMNLPVGSSADPGYPSNSFPDNSEHPSSNDDGAGKPVVPKQGNFRSNRQPWPMPNRHASRRPKRPRRTFPTRLRRLQATVRSIRENRRPKQARRTPRSSRPLPHECGAPQRRSSRWKDPSNSVKEGQRSDLPRAKPPSDKPQAVDRTAQRQLEAEARKLMLEDGRSRAGSAAARGPRSRRHGM